MSPRRQTQAPAAAVHQYQNGPDSRFILYLTRTAVAIIERGSPHTSQAVHVVHPRTSRVCHLTPSLPERSSRSRPQPLRSNHSFHRLPIWRDNIQQESCRTMPI